MWLWPPDGAVAVVASRSAEIARGPQSRSTPRRHRGRGRRRVLRTRDAERRRAETRSAARELGDVRARAGGRGVRARGVVARRPERARDRRRHPLVAERFPARRFFRGDRRSARIRRRRPTRTRTRRRRARAARCARARARDRAARAASRGGIFSGIGGLFGGLLEERGARRIRRRAKTTARKGSRALAAALVLEPATASPRTGSSVAAPSCASASGAASRGAVRAPEALTRASRRRC